MRQDNALHEWADAFIPRERDTANRKAVWALKYRLQVGRWPDGDIKTHQIAAGCHDKLQADARFIHHG